MPEKPDNLSNTNESNQMQELKENELLNRTQKIAKVGGWEINLSDMSVSWTEEVFRIHELSMDVKPRVEDGISYYAPEARPIITDAVNKAIEEGVPWDLELPFITAKGNHKWVRALGYPEQENGKTVRLSGVFQDITDLHLAQKEVSKVRERLEIATSSAKVGIWDWDIKKNELAWDLTMYELYGIKREDFSGAYESWRSGLHPVDSEKADQEIQMALEGKKSFDTQFRVIWPDDSIHHIRAKARVDRDEEGNAVRMLGTNWDITRETEAILREEQRIKELEVKNKELEQFAYVASHDLQEPLRTMNSYVDLLDQQHNNELSDEARKFMEVIKKASGRMTVLIKDLLEYSRIGRKEELDTVDCNQLLEEVLEDLELSIKEGECEIKFDSLPTIKGAESELKQLFQNLMSNAIKFKRRDEQAHIRVWATEETGCWSFHFQDNGIGIAKEHSDRIFTIFQRLHTREEYSGTGIGLALCRKIVNTHQGKIWVTSEQDHGCTFHFTIPKRVSRNNS